MASRPGIKRDPSHRVSMMTGSGRPARRRRDRTERQPGRLPSGSHPRSSRPYAAARTRARLRWSTVSSGRPKSRPPRQRTSMIASLAGGPGRPLRGRSRSGRHGRSGPGGPAGRQEHRGDERLGGIARRLRRGRLGSAGRSSMPPIVSIDAQPRLNGPAVPTAVDRCQASGGRALQRGQVERVERRVVGHDRDQLAREQIVGLGRRRVASRSRSSWSPASVRWSARNERRWNGGQPELADRHPVVERRVALVALPAVARVAQPRALIIRSRTTFATTDAQAIE